MSNSPPKGLGSNNRASSFSDPRNILSEKQMNNWIKEFVREVDAIDYFFVEKLQELVR